MPSNSNVSAASPALDAVSAVRAVIGTEHDAEAAEDLVEIVRPYIERPFVLALKAANDTISRLTEENEALKASTN